MKPLIAIAVLFVAGCTTAPPPNYPAALCPPLPEPPLIMTVAQRDAYTKQLIAMYGMCATSKNGGN